MQTTQPVTHGLPIVFPEPHQTMSRNYRVPTDRRRRQEKSVDQGQQDDQHDQTPRRTTAGKEPRLTVITQPTCAPDTVLVFVGDGDSRTEFVVPKQQLWESSPEFARQIDEDGSDNIIINLPNEDPDIFVYFFEYLEEDCRHCFANALMNKGAQHCGRCGHYNADGWDEMLLVYLYAFALRHAITNEFDSILYSAASITYSHSSTIPSGGAMLAARCALGPNDALYLMMLAYCLDALCDDLLATDDLVQKYAPEIVHDIMVWYKRLCEQPPYDGEGEEMMDRLMCRMNDIFHTVTCAVYETKEEGKCMHEVEVEGQGVDGGDDKMEIKQEMEDDEVEYEDE